MSSKHTYFNWSTGKDSSLALYHVQQDASLQVGRLVTSVNSYYDRVSMHGLRRELLEKQAASIGIPLTTIELPQYPTMEEYSAIMQQTVDELIADQFTDCVFGDIFLEDLRNYREDQLAPLNITAHFPLWKKDTRELMKEFVRLGFKAVVICIKSDLLDKSFLGRDLDMDFVNDLPENVDPCGENGEFHTFCYDGPIFNSPIHFDRGEATFREYDHPKNEDDTHPTVPEKMGFWFLDLVPK